MDQLVRAGIKPPEVYELARTLLPGIRLERPLTPQDLADLLIERVLATPARQEKGGPGL
ncbi:MAG: hypothetical protein NTY23_01890 [Chloroflexi bacterium]|nr:hypothetical protein [Chloroflexota bacterium]